MKDDRSPFSWEDALLIIACAIFLGAFLYLLAKGLGK